MKVPKNTLLKTAKQRAAFERLEDMRKLLELAQRAFVHANGEAVRLNASFSSTEAQGQYEELLELNIQSDFDDSRDSIIYWNQGHLPELTEEAVSAILDGLYVEE